MNNSLISECVFQCSRPTLCKFIGKIILEEDSNIHTQIIRANGGEPVNKQKNYQYLDQRLFNPVSYPHQSIIDQINATAHNIVV